MKKVILCLLALSFLSADIHISGDARVRPRYDLIENGNGSSTSDLYYLYRARLNMKSDIGGGWFFNSKLGTNSVASFSKMGANNIPSWESYNSDRPEIDFLELYFGYMNDNSGFWAGIIPLEYNPSLDLHFYSDIYLIDFDGSKRISILGEMPWILLNNSTTTGFAGYKKIMNHKLNWFLSIDVNKTNKTIDLNGETTELKDSYTLGFDTSFDVGPLLINPRLLISSNKTSFTGHEETSPMTYGADISLPGIAGFSTTLSYYVSGNDTNKDSSLVTDYYTSDHFRLMLTKQISTGTLKLFYDMASNDDGLSIDGADLSHESDLTSFLWMSYTMSVYKGDLGEVTISPTFRLQNGISAGSIFFDVDYSRAKFELTTQIKFN